MKWIRITLTTTSLAGISADLVKDIRERVPDLDLLSIQMYADIINLPQRIRESGWTGPYLVTDGSYRSLGGAGNLLGCTGREQQYRKKPTTYWNVTKPVSFRTGLLSGCIHILWGQNRNAHPPGTDSTWKTEKKRQR